MFSMAMTAWAAVFNHRDLLVSKGANLLTVDAKGTDNFIVLNIGC